MIHASKKPPASWRWRNPITRYFVQLHATGRGPARSRTRIGELLTLHGSDKDTTHSYGKLYEQKFIRYQYDDPISILEIGMQYGHSLNAWREYFPKAQVWGVDIEDKILTHDASINYVIGNITSIYVRNILAGQYFDVVIDDGSHQLPDVLSAFDECWNKVKPGGFYLIEDVQHPKEWEKALRSRHTAVECHDFRKFYNRHKDRYDDFVIVLEKP